MAVMRGLIVDDSKAMRELLSLIVTSIPGVEISAAVETSEEAWSYIRDRRIDFMILDLELPGKSGLELLAHCESFQSVPTIVISARLLDDPDLRKEVCDLGAVAALSKPDGQATTHEDLLIQIKAALAKIPKLAREVDKSNYLPTQILAIGASTGGVTAVQKVLTDVSDIDWPILITQHMSATYTPRFAESIARLTNRRAYEAASGMTVKNNSIYIAPGDKHMRVSRVRNHLEIILGSDGLISGHRPSVDAMFMSLADIRMSSIVAVLLTGMGNDGAHGMLRLRAQGVHTIAQDAGSSIVFGMARAAAELNAVDRLLPLQEIGPAVVQYASARIAQAR